MVPIHVTHAFVVLLFVAQVGSVRYEQISRTIRWEIGKLPKDKTPTLEVPVCLLALLYRVSLCSFALLCCLAIDCSCRRAQGGVSLPADFIADESPTVRAEFQCKMLALSGLKVDGLAIRGVKYKPFKGVRSVTQAGKFQVRCSAF